MNGTPEPTNDHERTIVAVVDGKLLASDSPYESIVAEIIISVPFDMSIADTQFLIKYVKWRLAHLVKRHPARGISPEDLKRSSHDHPPSQT
jgi:hypothetical protein